VGIIGAIVSVFLQKAVVAVAGFMAGGYLLYTLALGVQYQSLAWIGFVVGGVLGAILVVVLFDWALIALSVLTGAAVITRNAHLEPLLSVLLFVVLLVTGVVIQTRQLASARTPRAV
jgi:arginine exporter protein ArgO